MSLDEKPKSDAPFQTLKAPNGQILKIRNDFIAAVIPREQGNWADIYAKLLVRDANQCRIMPITGQAEDVEGNFIDFKNKAGAVVRVKPEFVTMVQGHIPCHSNAQTTITIDAGSSADVYVAESADEVGRRLAVRTMHP